MSSHTKIVCILVQEKKVHIEAVYTKHEHRVQLCSIQHHAQPTIMREPSYESHTAQKNRLVRERFRNVLLIMDQFPP